MPHPAETAMLAGPGAARSASPRNVGGSKRPGHYAPRLATSVLPGIEPAAEAELVQSEIFAACPIEQISDIRYERTSPQRGVSRA